MKKNLTILLIVACLIVGLFALTGCVNDKGNTTNPTATAVPGDTSGATEAVVPAEENPEEMPVEDPYKLEITKNENRIMVKIDGEKLDYEKLPWVGIVPVGVYKNEAEADSYDVTYTYVDETNFPNVELNIEGIGSGEWLVVLCDTDDEGRILGREKFTISSPEGISENTEASATETTYELEITKNENNLMVKINGEGLDYKKSPWVGIVPVGEYKDEAEADEYDVTYTYVNAENYPNIELNTEDVDEGEWLVILCDADDEGKVLAIAPVVL